MYKPGWHRLSEAWPSREPVAPVEIIAHAASSADLAQWLAEGNSPAKLLRFPDQARVVETLLAESQSRTRLWLLADAPASSAPADIEAAALRLLADLHARGLATPSLELRLVTRNATDGSVFGAGLQGLCHAWRQSGLNVACCDLDDAELSDPITRPGLLDLLRRVVPSERGDTIRLRHGAAFTRRLQPLRLSGSGAAPVPRKGGRYVIIGGAGLVGRTVSRHLIAHYGADIVWIGRTSPDDAGCGRSSTASSIPDGCRSICKRTPQIKRRSRQPRRGCKTCRASSSPPWTSPSAIRSK